jgi:acyl-CoA reductase-like NAD-dependent aldehyde dehydrogenase
MTYQTINPATGLIVQTYADISDTDLEKVLATAQACYETDWRHRSVAGRARIVSGAATKLRENARSMPVTSLSKWVSSSALREWKSRYLPISWTTMPHMPKRS